MDSFTLVADIEYQDKKNNFIIQRKYDVVIKYDELDKYDGACDMLVSMDTEVVKKDITKEDITGYYEKVAELWNSLSPLFKQWLNSKIQYEILSSANKAMETSNIDKVVVSYDKPTDY